MNGQCPKCGAPCTEPSPAASAQPQYRFREEQPDGTFIDVDPSEALSPATVAQPVALTDAELLKLAESVGVSTGRRNIWPPTFSRSIEFSVKQLRDFAALCAAQPCASQGCGGAVSEDDHYYNLLGVIADAKAGNFNAVCVETLERVAAALSTAPRSLDGATPGGKE